MRAFDREEALIGRDALEKLKASSVLVFGIGGVGGYVCETLARAGIGKIGLCDGDTVDETNINRQIIANVKTVGQNKTEVMSSRIADINPECKTELYTFIYSEKTCIDIDFSKWSYIIDAIDDTRAKVLIAVNADKAGVPHICCLGTGNKLTPAFEVTDIYKTSVCPLAKTVRHMMREAGVEKLKVVYSKEAPVKTGTGYTPSSISYVPPAAAMYLTKDAVETIIGNICS